MSAVQEKPGRLILNGVDGDDDENYSTNSSTNHTASSASPSNTTPPQPYHSLNQPNGDDTYGPTAVESQTQAQYRPKDRLMEGGSPLSHNRNKLPTRPSTSPANSSYVNPATIPTRTSSTYAVASTDMANASSSHSRKSSYNRKSMASVPEEQRHHTAMDERDWISSGKQHRHSLPASAAGSSVPYGQNISEARQDMTMGHAATKLESIQNIGADLINGHAESWSREKENILKGPFDYLESHPGKDVRSQMISAFNAWLQVPEPSLRIITGVITMLHTASLLIDDVEDSSQLRRGVPVAHSIFGTAQTINSANYMYFCALQEVLKLNHPEAIKIYTEELLNLHRGQGMDLFWRDTLTCPSEDDYLEMVGNKTGGLFRLAIKLMCAASGPSESDFATTVSTYVPLVNTIGLLFQILDDYRNLSDTVYTANKGLCEDLTEGKFSFPVIHAIRADPANLVLINILKQKTTDEDVKRYAVAYMERCGSFSYTRRVLRGLTKKALALVDEVDAGRGRADGVRSILEKLRVEKHNRDESGRV